ncbi:hypothetical protein BC567DRAFT_218173 [Phyllosticta citribraziliensis]
MPERLLSSIQTPGWRKFSVPNEYLGKLQRQQRVISSREMLEIPEISSPGDLQRHLMQPSTWTPSPAYDPVLYRDSCPLLLLTGVHASTCRQMPTNRTPKIESSGSTFDRKPGPLNYRHQLFSFVVDFFTMTGKTTMTHRSQEMELRDLEVGESQCRCPTR